MKYDVEVEIVESTIYMVEVHADSIEAAKERAKKMYTNRRRSWVTSEEVSEPEVIACREVI